jgi:lia operon protein LiaF
LIENCKYRKEGDCALSQSVNQFIFAAILLFVGIFLLLMNIGVISLEIKEVIVEFYPFLFLLFSFLLILKALKGNKKGSLFWWFFFFSFSLMLCLDRLELITFHAGDFWRLWPVLFIYYGLVLLIKKDKVKIYFKPDVPPETLLIKHQGDEELELENDIPTISGKRIKSFSIGDVEYKKSNWSLEPMNLHNSIGDYFIDFSKAYIPEKETPIHVHGWIGDVKMIVPDDVPVKVEAKVKIGDIRIFDLRSSDINRQLVYETPGYHEAIKKLNITIELKVGSVRIDQA